MMIDTPCARSQCPEMPKVSLDQAVVDLMESIALQETALSHILCAESRKMQKAMDLDGLDLCKLLEVNDSATNMVHAVANLELVLKDKLEFVSNNLYVPGDSGCPSPAPYCFLGGTIFTAIYPMKMQCRAARGLPGIVLLRAAAREAAAQNRVQQPPFL